MKDYYRFDFDRYINRALRNKWSPEELLVSRVFMEDIYTNCSLRRTGLSDEDINTMVETGSLKKVRVDHGTSTSLGLKDKYADDPEYRMKIVGVLKRSRENMMNDPDYLRKRKKSTKKASMAFARRARKRRNILLKDIILPNFGIKTNSGYEPPESICVAELVEFIENNDECLETAEWHYKILDHRKFSMEIYKDVVALGIRPKTNVEIGDRISKKLKDKATRDRKYMEYLQETIRYATQLRMELYEAFPDIKKDHIQKMVDARMKKLDEDPEYRMQVLFNLALGNPAYQEKMRNDPKFRERQLKKHGRALDKGRRTIMRRAERRRDALYKYVIGPEFGGLDCRIGTKRLEVLLNNKYTRIRNKYYSNSKSIYRRLKRDLWRLRKDSLANTI